MGKFEPSVDILIVTYNQEQFIDEAIKSAVEQDYENLKVVVADDCSTDQTPEIIKRWTLQYPERIIAVLGDKNLGITGNSNRGLSQCHGDLMCHMGGDDILLPGKVRKQADWFKRHSDGALCGHIVEQFNEQGTLSYIGKNITGMGLENAISVGPIYPSVSMMVKRNLIPDYGYDPRVPIVSDWKLCLDVLSSGGRYGFIPECLARYRRHGNNITSKYELMYQDQLECCRICRDEFPEYVKEIDHAKWRFTYILALNHLRYNQFKQACQFFYQSICFQPLRPKAYVWLLIALYKYLFTKNIKR